MENTVENNVSEVVEETTPEVKTYTQEEVLKLLQKQSSTKIAKNG